jgi:hypothetical protein
MPGDLDPEGRNGEHDMAKAVWPEYTWEGDPDDGGVAGKVCRSSDGRVVIRAVLRYGIPETWAVLVIVYGPGGHADERQGWFDMKLEASFDGALQRAKDAVLASGLVDCS